MRNTSRPRNDDPEPGSPVGTPCWRETTTWDVFDEEGRFLGDAELPEGTQMFPPPYVRGDLFLAAYLAAYMDEVGTVMVKRYRIVLPG